MTIHPLNPSRRSMLAGGGALILSFSLSRYPALAQDAPKPAPLPGDLKKAPFLDSGFASEPMEKSQFSPANQSSVRE